MREELGIEWQKNHLFRLGASALVRIARSSIVTVGLIMSAVGIPIVVVTYCYGSTMVSPSLLPCRILSRPTHPTPCTPTLRTRLSLHSPTIAANR